MLQWSQAARYKERSEQESEEEVADLHVAVEDDDERDQTDGHPLVGGRLPHHGVDLIKPFSSSLALRQNKLKFLSLKGHTPATVL